MVQMKYTGIKDAREITEQDFAAIPSGLGGPLTQQSVTWDAFNLYTAEVSEDAAKWLESSYPGDFARISKKEAKEQEKIAEANLAAQIMPDRQVEEEPLEPEA